MQYKDIGAAVVGSGFIGPVHIEGLKRLSVDVRGILGSRPEKSDRAARELNLPTAYQSYEELLEDDSVHVVHLAVPNVLHYDMSKKAIAAGKHVMCEKPLAMDAKESAELVELAAASNVHCGVTYNQRFYPLNLETRARIQDGEIGLAWKSKKYSPTLRPYIPFGKDPLVKWRPFLERSLRSRTPKM